VASAARRGFRSGKNDGSASPDAPSVAHDLRLTPQAKLVRSYLKKHGNISPMEAERVYGIARPASCMHEIRNGGYFVHTAMRRDDYGHKYARYEFVNRVN